MLLKRNSRQKGTDHTKLATQGEPPTVDSEVQYKRDLVRHPLMDDARRQYLIHHITLLQAEISQGAYDQTTQLEAYRKELIEGNLRLVLSRAFFYHRVFRGHGIDLMDLIQEGNVGLILGISRYNEERARYLHAHQLSSYITSFIDGYMKTYILTNIYLVHVPTHLSTQLRRVRRKLHELESQKATPVSNSELADALGIHESKVEALLQQQLDTLYFSQSTSISQTQVPTTLGDSIESEVDIIEQLLTEIAYDDLRKRLAFILPQNQCDILFAHYGLFEDPPRSLQEIADSRNLPFTYVRKLHDSALTKLRNPSINGFLRGIYQE